MLKLITVFNTCVGWYVVLAYWNELEKCFGQFNQWQTHILAWMMKIADTITVHSSGSQRGRVSSWCLLVISVLYFELWSIKASSNWTGTINPLRACTPRNHHVTDISNFSQKKNSLQVDNSFREKCWSSSWDLWLDLNSDYSDFSFIL